MEKKLSFFVETPLDERDYQRFGIDLLQRRGFDVEVVDLTDILHPDYKTLYQVPDLSHFSRVVRPSGWDEVESHVRSAGGRYGIMMVAYADRTRRLYEIFKKTDFLYAQFCSNMLPFPPRFTWRKLATLPGRLTPAWILKKFRSLAFRADAGREQEAQPPRCILRGSRMFQKNYPGPAEGPATVWTHTLDYDLFLRAGPPRREAAPTAVFLDEFLPFHPDYLLEKDMDPRLDPAAYYEGLNRFFDHVEKSAGLSVVIAVHPRARYEDMPDPFRGRRREKGATVELVRDSSLVLAHASTALNFAILYRKPVILLTNKRLDRSYEGGNLWNFARLLGKRPVRTDRPIACDVRAESRVDEALYARYAEDYIKVPGTPERPFWDIVADHLERIAA